MQNDLTKELSTNFIEYAVAVNTDRAIPDAKSGLKPVAKRILWSAFEEGRTSSKPHVKAARIVGDVMGKYHPHGDSSIYGAMVRLSQPWVMRYPLIDWHGNNGNIAGDGPAAARYTEARLSKISEEGMLNGIKKKNVNFIPNYDETLEEPITLPSAFPNLLCNPNTGIGVAMACNWAPHNLVDVSNAIYNYLSGNDITLPGPDFPTGGLIINKNDIPKIMETGRGSVKIRARYKIEGKNKNKIIFYEIPYGTTIEGLITELGEICDKEEIKGIHDIHDESSKEIRIVVTCQKGFSPDAIAKQIYAKTNFQTSFSYNQVALVDKTPTELNLRDAIKIYVNHNLECIVKECQFDLEKAKARLEIVEGLLKALEDIDNIIALIKQSESAAAAKINLISKYNFTENQAKAILAMRLSSLAKLEKVELKKEAEELKNKIFMLNCILDSRDEQIGILKVRLQGLVNKYGDKRRTELTQIDDVKEEKEKIDITPEDVVVIITHTGDIKRIPKKSFRIQKRNGKGVKTMDAAIKTTISTNTLDDLMIFTSKGKMYKLAVDKIPEGTNASRGTNLHLLLPFTDNEVFQTATAISGEKPADYVVFFTKNGLIKKTEIEEYTKTKKKTGIQAIKIKDDDELLSVTFMNKEDIIIGTKFGNVIRVPSDDINPIGKLTCGVKGIALKENDEVVSAFYISKDTKYLGIFTHNGNSKKMDMNNFTIQKRNGRGNNIIPLEEKDYVTSIVPLTKEDSLLVVGKPNSICTTVQELSEQTKFGYGTKIIERSTVQSVIVL
jgi:DNA gyrase subunit A